MYSWLAIEDGLAFINVHVHENFDGHFVPLLTVLYYNKLC